VSGNAVRSHVQQPDTPLLSATYPALPCLHVGGVGSMSRFPRIRICAVVSSTIVGVLRQSVGVRRRM